MRFVFVLMQETLECFYIGDQSESETQAGTICRRLLSKRNLSSYLDVSSCYDINRVIYWFIEHDLYKLFNTLENNRMIFCNTNKPGISEGGVGGGRAGGYRELDEEELEETKRRRWEAEEDDGEMYDEFRNLKKKFRVPGTGRAGSEVEVLGTFVRIYVFFFYFS
ncbi:hypothetical protein Hdeb2414_s0018g00522991 [Helianthus debilis subsp. tardiflorus]